MSSPGRRTKAFERLLRDERGAGMVEYLILVGCIGLAAQTAFARSAGHWRVRPTIKRR
jgi:hypothetical protein